MSVIQKNGVVKVFRNFALLCVFLVGFMAIVGSDSDDAKDLIDIDFEEDATITLPAVTVDNNLRIASAVGANCGVTSVKDEIKKLEDNIDDLDLIDIDSVVLRYIMVSYSAQWVPSSITDLTCKLAITGDQNTSIAEMAINNPTGESTLELTQEQEDVINYYLSNRDKEFTYCVECNNDELISEFIVSYTAELGVTIKGEF